MEIFYGPGQHLSELVPYRFYFFSGSHTAVATNESAHP